MLVRHTILCLFVHLPAVFILWRGRTFQALKMSYAAALMRRCIYDIHLPLYLRITIGSVVLTSSVYIGTILASALLSISYDFSLFDCWVPERQAWWLVPMSGWEKGGVYLSSWKLYGWLLWKIFLNIPMLQQGRVLSGGCDMPSRWRSHFYLLLSCFPLCEQWWRLFLIMQKKRHKGWRKGGGGGRICLTCEGFSV